MRFAHVLTVLVFSVAANAQESALLSPPEDNTIFYNAEISGVLKKFAGEITENAQANRKAKAVIASEYVIGSAGLIGVRRAQNPWTRAGFGFASVALLGKAAYDTARPRDYRSVNDAWIGIEFSSSMYDLNEQLQSLFFVVEPYEAWKHLRSDLTDDIINAIDLKQSAKKRCAQWSARLLSREKPDDIAQKCEEAVLKSLAEPKPEPPKKAEGRRHKAPENVQGEGHG